MRGRKTLLTTALLTGISALIRKRVFEVFARQRRRARARAFRRMVLRRVGIAAATTGAVALAIPLLRGAR